MLARHRFAELFPGDQFWWEDGVNSRVLKCWKTQPQIVQSKSVANALWQGKPVFVPDDDEVDLIIP